MESQEKTFIQTFFLQGDFQEDQEDATLTKSNTVLNLFLSYFWKLFLTCFVK